jgi:hypothetical protein
MKRNFWIFSLLVLIALLAFNQWRLNQKLTALLAERENAEPVPPIAAGDRDLKDLQARLDRADLELAAANQKLADLSARLAEFDRKTAQLSVTPRTRRNSLPDNPPDPQPAKGRGWGPEQATGAPDTPGAGDISTAWAALTPDGGIEWLKLDYQTMVNAAQIRVRETYNPGAVFKITNILPDGQESVLWEGVENPDTVPFDSVFNISGTAYVRSVKIYFDTSRVRGWNEIDAVELVARDGFSQWASQASASSTYADQLTTTTAVQPPP